MHYDYNKYLYLISPAIMSCTLHVDLEPTQIQDEITSFNITEANKTTQVL